MDFSQAPRIPEKAGRINTITNTSTDAYVPTETNSAASTEWEAMGTYGFHPGILMESQILAGDKR